MPPIQRPIRRPPPPPYTRMRQRGRPSINPLLILLVSLVSFIFIVGIGLYLLTAKSVTVLLEGTSYPLFTHQATVAALLRESGVTVEPGDSLLPALETPLQSGMVIQIAKAVPVWVEADGQRQQFRTRSRQPGEILAQAGIVLNAADRVFVDGLPLVERPYLEPISTIQVVRARPIQIDTGSGRVTVVTAAETVGEALAAARLELFIADRVEPPPHTPLPANGTIRVVRAVPMTILVDGRQLATRSAAETVGEVLAEAGIALVGLDYCIPSEGSPAQPEMTIQVIRVTEEDEIERREIAYRQVYQPDETIPPETTKIIQPGVNGLLERRVRIRREDGTVVSRSQPEDVIVRDPQDEIIAIGATPSLVTPPPTPAGS